MSEKFERLTDRKKELKTYESPRYEIQYSQDYFGPKQNSKTKDKDEGKEKEMEEIVEEDIPTYSKVDSIINA